MSEFFLGTVGRGKVGRTQYVDNKTHTRGQDKHIRPPKIGGRVASLVATVAHVKSLMDMSNQWSLSVLLLFKWLQLSAMSPTSYILIHQHQGSKHITAFIYTPTQERKAEWCVIQRDRAHKS